MQEVKIKPGDTKTTRAIRAVINDVGGSSCDNHGRRNLHSYACETDIGDDMPCDRRLEGGGSECDVRSNLPLYSHYARGAKCTESQSSVRISCGGIFNLSEKLYGIEKVVYSSSRPKIFHFQ